MYKSIASLIGLNLCIAFSPTPLSFIQPAHAGDASLSCQATLRSVQAKLKRQPNLNVISINQRDLFQSHPNYPQGRPKEYVIALGGSQASNFLKSRQLMTTLATQIIRNCETVSLVTFGTANSGDVVNLGLMPNGSIQIFECLEPGRDSPDRRVWGKVFCV